MLRSCCCCYIIKPQTQHFVVHVTRKRSLLPFSVNTDISSNIISVYKSDIARPRAQELINGLWRREAASEASLCKWPRREKARVGSQKGADLAPMVYVDKRGGGWKVSL